MRKALILGLALAGLAACADSRPSYSPTNGVGGQVDGGNRPANIPGNEKQPLTTNPRGAYGP